MSNLIIKAVREIKELNDKVGVNAYGMSDSLHDIQMHLETNKDELPEKGEVSTKELFNMLNNVISSMDKIQEDAKQLNEWVNAVLSS